MKMKIFIIPVLAAMLLSFLHKGNSAYAFNPARFYKKIAVEKSAFLEDDKDNDFFVGNGIFTGTEPDQKVEQFAGLIEGETLNAISSSVPLLHLDLPPPPQIS